MTASSATPAARLRARIGLAIWLTLVVVSAAAIHGTLVPHDAGIPPEPPARNERALGSARAGVSGATSARLLRPVPAASGTTGSQKNAGSGTDVSASAGGTNGVAESESAGSAQQLVLAVAVAFGATLGCALVAACACIGLERRSRIRGPREGLEVEYAFWDRWL